MLAAEGVVDMYSDFAGEYDDVVLGEYKYVAHQVYTAYIHMHHQHDRDNHLVVNNNR